MTVKDLLKNESFSAVNIENEQREIKSVYCCDLLSIVMGKAPADCAWVTVMGNINAVASNADSITRAFIIFILTIMFHGYTPTHLLLWLLRAPFLRTLTTCRFHFLSIRNAFCQVL